MVSRTVKIEMKDKSLTVRLLWDRFDGDDCFDDFRITVAPSAGESRVYEFGPCAVRAVRKMKQFLSDPTIESVGGGFRHPDIRTYEWTRVGDDLKLIVKFEGRHSEAVHTLRNPIIATDEPKE